MTTVLATAENAQCLLHDEERSESNKYSQPAQIRASEYLGYVMDAP